MPNNINKHHPKIIKFAHNLSSENGLGTNHLIFGWGGVVSGETQIQVRMLNKCLLLLMMRSDDI